MIKNSGKQFYNGTTLPLSGQATDIEHNRVNTSGYVVQIIFKIFFK